MVSYTPAWCRSIGDAIIEYGLAFKPIRYRGKPAGVKLKQVNEATSMIAMNRQSKTILRSLVAHLENGKKARELANHLNILVRDICNRRGGFQAVEIFTRICACYSKKVPGIFLVQGQELFQLEPEVNQDDVLGYGPDGMQSRGDLNAESRAYLVQQDENRAAALRITDARREARRQREQGPEDQDMEEADL